MSKLTARAKNGIVSVKTPAGDGWYTSDLTVEESRALRVELEKAEEEATRKSAFREWWETRTHGAPVEVWNAAIEAAINATATRGLGASATVLRALKEPVE